MQEQSTGSNSLFIIQGVLATIIAGLMFYPMFGGTLMILNGTFIYFSYFLAVFLVAILALVDFISLFVISRKKENRNYKMNVLAFLFVSFMVMIGLLEGHYVFSPLLAVMYIFMSLMEIFQIASNKKESDVFFQVSILDVIQRIFFYITAIIILLGNQPFEIWGIPIATTALFVLNVIFVVNFGAKLRNI